METTLHNSVGSLNTESLDRFLFEMETMKIKLKIDERKYRYGFERAQDKLQIKEYKWAELLSKLANLKAQQNSLPADKSANAILRPIERIEVDLESLTRAIEELRLTAAIAQTKYELVKVQLDSLTHILTFQSKEQ